MSSIWSSDHGRAPPRRSRRNSGPAVDVLRRVRALDQRALNDRRGKCCLVGALDFVSNHHATRGDAAERYLADAIADQREQRPRCHGDGTDYARLRAALRRAMRGEWYQASEAVLRRDSLSDFNVSVLLIETSGSMIGISPCSATARQPRIAASPRQRYRVWKAG